MPRLGGVTGDRARGLCLLAVEELEEVAWVSCHTPLLLPPPPRAWHLGQLPPCAWLPRPYPEFCCTGSWAFWGSCHTSLPLCTDQMGLRWDPACLRDAPVGANEHLLASVSKGRCGK